MGSRRDEGGVGSWCMVVDSHRGILGCCDVLPSARGRSSRVHRAVLRAPACAVVQEMCGKIIPCAAAAYGKRHRREGGKKWRAVIHACHCSIEGLKNWRLVKRSRKVLQGAVADTRTSIGCWTRAETIYRKPWPLAAKGADGRGATSGGQLFMHAIDKKAENPSVCPAV